MSNTDKHRRMNTVFLSNGLHLKPKKCSSAADAVDRVPAKCSRLFGSSHGDSSLATILIVGMIFNCIQGKNFNRYSVFLVI